jgi:hypothetical protein
LRARSACAVSVCRERTHLHLDNGLRWHNVRRALQRAAGVHSLQPHEVRLSMSKRLACAGKRWNDSQRRDRPNRTIAQLQQLVAKGVQPYADLRPVISRLNARIAPASQRGAHPPAAGRSPIARGAATVALRRAKTHLNRPAGLREQIRRAVAVSAQTGPRTLRPVRRSCRRLPPAKRDHATARYLPRPRASMSPLALPTRMARPSMG